MKKFEKTFFASWTDLDPNRHVANHAYIKYAILTSKYGVQEYIINRAKKEKSALLRNAKIRLSNIHPGRLLMNLRGQDKWLK